MNQTRLESLAETCINVAVGFVLSYCLGMVLYPALGHPVSHGQNLVITAAFTALSIARSYAIRRWANRHLRALAQAVAAKIGGL